ncbi:MAG: hypothetical protein B6229_06380 [Spirochaetaceae bacterium 4572_7]|nr:MAG: hypothetical protein B6229_06380 [Spirochaetaceae bacterium 4572_7]
MHPFVSSVSFTSLLISIFYGGNLVMNQVISLGDLVSFIALIGMMTWPMMALGFMFTLMQRGKVSLIRINEILNAEDEVLEVPHGHKLEGSAISVRNLSFSYPGTMVKALDNISFNVNAGETLAIVGHTGAGKTTIVESLKVIFYSRSQ